MITFDMIIPLISNPLFLIAVPSLLEVMDKDEVFDIVKVTEEVESYNQVDVTTPKKRKSKAQEVSSEKPKKPR